MKFLEGYLPTTGTGAARIPAMRVDKMMVENFVWKMSDTTRRSSTKPHTQLSKEDDVLILSSTISSAILMY